MKKDPTIIFNENMRVAKSLSPIAIFRHFTTLCWAPRGSGNEAGIARIIRNIASEWNHESITDKAHNVLVRVDATPGMENVPPVCLQAHIDMVEAKDKGVEEIFPIELMLTDDGKLTAKGTTLGADNGIGVAAILAFMTDETGISHGPLELLCTTDEERGLEGAKAFDYSLLKSKIIINLDSEEWGQFFVGCAGGGRIEGVLEPEYSLVPAADYYKKYSIDIKDFKGGHSGMEIHLGRANAVLVLAELLLQLKPWGISLIEFSGGEAMNAIPTFARANILVPMANEALFIQAFVRRLGEIRMNYHEEDPLIICKNETASVEEKVMSDESFNRLLKLLFDLPYGVVAMEPENNEMVQTSNNVGMVRMEDDGKIRVTAMYRSSLDAETKRMEGVIISAFQKNGATVELKGSYEAWEPKFDTELVKKASAIFEEMFGYAPKVVTIHAGLELAIISKKMPADTQMFSFGPTMECVHTTSEWVDVASVQKFWDFLLKLLISL